MVLSTGVDAINDEFILDRNTTEGAQIARRYARLGWLPITFDTLPLALFYFVCNESYGILNGQHDEFAQRAVSP